MAGVSRGVSLPGATVALTGVFRTPRSVLRTSVFLVAQALLAALWSGDRMWESRSPADMAQDCRARLFYKQSAALLLQAATWGAGNSAESLSEAGPHG